MPTCAFVPCSEANSCCLVGGCVQERFAAQIAAERQSQEKPLAKPANKKEKRT